MDIKKLTNKYFKYFVKKDLDNLDKLFHDDIELVDPGNKIKGKKRVLVFNKNFFQKFKKIKIKVLHQSINKEKKNSFSYIIVSLNNQNFHVVDF